MSLILEIEVKGSNNCEPAKGTTIWGEGVTTALLRSLLDICHGPVATIHQLQLMLF